MKRLIAGTLAALLAVGLLVGFAPSPASAAPTQVEIGVCFPGDDADYPPTGPAVQIEATLRLVSGQFNPGGTSVIVVIGAQPNERYCGILASHRPLLVPPTNADASGRITFHMPDTPTGFELGAMHHLDVYRNQALVGAFDFCVDKSGAVAAASACTQKPGKSGNLPKTGSDFLDDALRAAVVALGLGAGAMYLRRRRMQRAA